MTITTQLPMLRVYWPSAWSRHQWRWPSPPNHPYHMYTIWPNVWSCVWPSAWSRHPWQWLSPPAPDCPCNTYSVYWPSAWSGHQWWWPSPPIIVHTTCVWPSVWSCVWPSAWSRLRWQWPLPPTCPCHMYMTCILPEADIDDGDLRHLIVHDPVSEAEVHNDDLQHLIFHVTCVLLTCRGCVYGEFSVFYG